MSKIWTESDQNKARVILDRFEIGQILARGKKKKKAEKETANATCMAIDLLGRYDFRKNKSISGCMHVLGNVYEYPCSEHSSFLAMGGKTNCITRVWQQMESWSKIYEASYTSEMHDACMFSSCLGMRSACVALLALSIYPWSQNDDPNMSILCKRRCRCVFWWTALLPVCGVRSS